MKFVFGEPIRLPSQFLHKGNSEQSSQSQQHTVDTLRRAIAQLRPKIRRHRRKTTFVFKDLQTTSKVFVRHDAPAGTLQLLRRAVRSTQPKQQKLQNPKRKEHPRFGRQAQTSVHVGRREPANNKYKPSHRNDDNDQDNIRN